MPYESPASIIFDINGIPMAVTGGVTVPVSTSALLAGGMTSTGLASYLLTDPDGTLHVTGSFSTIAAGTQTVTGSVALTQPVNQGNAGSTAQAWFIKLTDGTSTLGTGSSAPIFVQQAVVTGSAVSAVARTTSSVALVASPSQLRRGVTIFNDTAANLYVLYGSGTVNSTTNYSIRLAAQSYLEVPDNFNGPVYGLWASTGSGNALVTVFTQ